MPYYVLPIRPLFFALNLFAELIVFVGSFNVDNPPVLNAVAVCHFLWLGAVFPLDEFDLVVL